MDFALAWATFDPGDYVSVSDGSPEPSVTGGPRWWMWRSHNFVGQLIEKDDTAPRTMLFKLNKAGDAEISFRVSEAVSHTYIASTSDAFASG